MWNTPDGVKRLEQPYAGLWAFGASYLLDYYSDSVVSDLGDPDEPFFQNILDQLSPDTVAATLLRVSQSLLSDDPPLDPDAYDEAMVEAVWKTLICQVDASIGRDRYPPVMKALRAANKLYCRDDGDRPYRLNNNDEIDMLLESLADLVLWDRDFTLDILTDLPPEVLRAMEIQFGIRAGYFDLPAPASQSFDQSRQALWRLLEPFEAPYLPKKRKKKR